MIAGDTLARTFTMDLRKALVEFILATLPAVLLYFIGWVYLSSYLSSFGINVSELQFDIPTIFIYSFSPFQTIINRHWIYIIISIVLIVILIFATILSIKKFVPARIITKQAARARCIWKTACTMPPILYGFVGFIVTLVAFSLIVVPTVRWSSEIAADQLWKGEGAVVEPILPGDIKVSSWIENYQKCGERRALGLIFSDQSSYYLLCISAIVSGSGVVYEIRRKVGITSIRYVTNR